MFENCSNIGNYRYYEYIILYDSNNNLVEIKLDFFSGLLCSLMLINFNICIIKNCYSTNENLKT